MKRLILALLFGCAGCGSEMPALPSVPDTPASRGAPSSEPVEPLVLPTSDSEPSGNQRVEPVGSTLEPEDKPELPIVDDEDSPVVDEAIVVPAQQVAFIELPANEVQLELQTCSDYKLVVVAPGQLIVESTTAEAGTICFLINAQLIPGLKGRDLTLNDKIQIGDFDFVIVARG